MPKRNECLPALRNEEERNALVVQYLELVPWSLFQVRPSLKSVVRFLGWADAQQEGRLALIRDAEIWDQTKGKFSTYAVLCIRGRVRSAAAVRQRLLLHARSLQVADRDRLAGIGDDPIEEAIRSETRQFLWRLFKTLSYREGKILELRFGLSPDNYGMTYSLEEVGHIFNVTRERIREIEARALGKLRSKELSLRFRLTLQQEDKKTSADKPQDDPWHSPFSLSRLDSPADPA